MKELFQHGLSIRALIVGAFELAAVLADDSWHHDIRPRLSARLLAWGKRLA